MLPWRPLGMLIFGLTVIFCFIRLHGNGYDFPVEIAKLNYIQDKLDFSTKPDKTFLEISGVYHDHFRESEDYIRSDGVKDRGQKFIIGWNSQWRLGKKDNKHVDSSGDTELNSMDEKQEWIWMTNIWYSDGDCGPGYLRQYRRRLDHVLASDNTTSWELMFVHKFPGAITHTSLSKRLIPEPRVSDTHKQDGASSEQKIRESIRLAIVYKVAQDEKCKSRSIDTETCHVHEPFLNFDYVLPGSTPIKDFTLEHDLIIYSRLSDTTTFRSLKLPQLEPGSTSFQHPYVLSSGIPGTPLGRDQMFHFEEASLQGFLPDQTDDLFVMIGQVQEYESNWIYRVDVESVTTNLYDGAKKWFKSDLQWKWDDSKPSTHEPDMIDEEPHVYGAPVQKPYVIRSADGSSFHVPVSDRVASLETNLKYYMDTDTNENEDTKGEDQRQAHVPAKQLSLKQLREENPGAVFSEQWYEASINTGSTHPVDTEYGVISDAGDVMVLKTTRNGLLILKRDIAKSTSSRRYGPWQLAMAMDDLKYNPFSENLAKREVLAMKVVRAPMLAFEEIDGDVNADGAKGKNEVPDPQVQSSDGYHKDEESIPSEIISEDQETALHNILGRSEDLF
ncbi:hypothetical protein BGZ46_007138 [Entomortierella lignicola]|nr:hypothetical protein BGZ46_007138 [Entomortierella lignicola]